jgi:hypothetical protein
MPRPLSVRVAAIAAVTCVAALATARPAAAQFPRAPRPARPARPTPDHVIAANPLILLLGSVQADYEERLSESLSWGVGAQYDGPSSLLFSANSVSTGYDVDVGGKLRFYPDRRALDGTSFTVVGGATRYERRRRDNADPTLPAERTRVVPTFGLSLDNNRFLGARRQYLLGTGFGVKRRFERQADPAYDRFNQIRFTWRVALGYAW